MQSLHWSVFVKNLVHDLKTASLPRQLIAFAVFEKMFFAKELREWEIRSISEIIFTFQVWAQKIKCFQINFVHQAVHNDKRTVVFKIRSFPRLLFSVVRCWRRFASNLHWVIVFSCSLADDDECKEKPGKLPQAIVPRLSRACCRDQFQWKIETRRGFC